MLLRLLVDKGVLICEIEFHLKKFSYISVDNEIEMKISDKQFAQHESSIFWVLGRILKKSNYWIGCESIFNGVHPIKAAFAENLNRIMYF